MRKSMKTAAMTAISITALISGLSAPAMAEDTLAKACGKQWTIADTNHDLTLSRKEAEASRDMDFARLDQNGDGKISQQEWAACNDMSMAGRMIDHTGAGKEAKPAVMVPDIAQADADKSGSLSREEVVKAMKQRFAEANDSAKTSESAEGDADKDMSDTGKAMGEEAQARFSGAWFALHDENSDGEISPQEVAEANLAHASSRRFKRLDENADGHISREEYDKTVTSRYEAAQERASGGLPVTVWHYYILVN